MSKPSSNRERFAQLIEETGMTRKEVADYLAQETRRPCSWRSVHAWLADPGLMSARPCPDWAIQLLEDYLAKRKETQAS